MPTFAPNDPDFLDSITDTEPSMARSQALVWELDRQTNERLLDEALALHDFSLLGVAFRRLQKGLQRDAEEAAGAAREACPLAYSVAIGRHDAARELLSEGCAEAFDPARALQLADRSGARELARDIQDWMRDGPAGAPAPEVPADSRGRSVAAQFWRAARSEQPGAPAVAAQLARAHPALWTRLDPPAHPQFAGAKDPDCTPSAAIAFGRVCPRAEELLAALWPLMPFGSRVRLLHVTLTYPSVSRGFCVALGERLCAARTEVREELLAGIGHHFKLLTWKLISGWGAKSGEVGHATDRAASERGPAMQIRACFDAWIDLDESLADEALRHMPQQILDIARPVFERHALRRVVQAARSDDSTPATLAAEPREPRRASRL
ncbi:hypothetical protein BX589_101113 [Paraburkholderia fungorum]|jgi:hypothetical protein|uniref:hypothetical protein n=1 Tax=Paraburkholderia fungorum TaxID=134537 RepID=UPI000D06B2FA|nr:hypothetical protein [Paraburkholderia fungorum]PRZ56463.1 hypothetical protein BX589_101113 [Paraburkholderia fungorum]